MAGYGTYGPVGNGGYDPSTNQAPRSGGDDIYNADSFRAAYAIDHTAGYNDGTGAPHTSDLHDTDKQVVMTSAVASAHEPIPQQPGYFGTTDAPTGGLYQPQQSAPSDTKNLGGTGPGLAAAAPLPAAVTYPQRAEDPSMSVGQATMPGSDAPSGYARNVSDLQQPNGFSGPKSAPRPPVGIRTDSTPHVPGEYPKSTPTF